MRRLKTFRVQLACEPRDKYGKADGPDAAASIARAAIEKQGDADKEQFLVLGLNARGWVIGFKIVSVGTLTTTLVHPREVFGAALDLRAASIIVAHNHPSGDATPSPEDHDLTERLKEVGELFGIPVVDHLVLGDSDWTSAMYGR